MKKIIQRGLIAGTAAILAAVAYGPSVSAQSSSSAPQTFQVNLAQANKSGASGTATLTLTGNSLKVSLRASGVSANQAHALHLHAGGRGACAATNADGNRDGFVDSKEAESAVGPIKISLTNSGDTAPGSALAVDRMPKADNRGNLSYDRTFNLPSGVSAADMQRATIDIHGISSLFNDKARYDGDKKSELDNRLPFETTAIAACGALASAPNGTLNTGFGSTAGIESPVLLTAGAIALMGALGLVVYSRRPFAADRK